MLDVPPGRVDARAGEAAYQAVRIAAELALDKKVDAIVTAPLSKAALHAAGHHYPGHTELLAEMCGVTDFAMMLYLCRPGGRASLTRLDPATASASRTSRCTNRCAACSPISRRRRSSPNAAWPMA